jgi:hypothetical protein
MLQNFTFSEKEEDKVGHFQKDGTPPHYINIICDALKGRFPDLWKGKDARSVGF